jgi:hypothetical protein
MRGTSVAERRMNSIGDITESISTLSINVGFEAVRSCGPTSAWGKRL